MEGEAVLNHFDESEDTDEPDFNQVELRRWVSEYLDHKIAVEEFKYCFESFLGNDGICPMARLAQATVNLATAKQVVHIYDDLSPLYAYFIEHSTVSSLDECLTVLDPFIDASLDSYAENWEKNRTVCCVLLIMLENFPRLIDNRTGIILGDYLIRIIAESENLEAKLLAMLTVECMQNLCDLHLDTERKSQLKNAIHLFASFRDFSDNDDAIEYMLNYCALWTKEYEEKLQSSRYKIPRIKLSRDHFSVRNDRPHCFIPVRSSFEVSSGVYFYEVTILTVGPMRIGWSSAQAQFTAQQTVGDDAHSVGIDISKTWISWHEGRPHENSFAQSKGSVWYNLPRWQSGDVLGFLIDKSSKVQLMLFYHNGRCMLYSHHVHNLRYCNYYATASLSPHQQCYFNFGQRPFRYPPNDYVQTSQYTSFHAATGGDVDKYRFVEPTMIQGIFRFDETLKQFDEEFGDGSANQDAPDLTQDNFDKTVAEIELELLQSHPEWEQLTASLDAKIYSVLEEQRDHQPIELRVVRLFRSFINQVGHKNKSDNHDKQLTNLIKIWNFLYRFFETQKLTELENTSGLAHIPLPKPAMILENFREYFSPNVQNIQQQIRQRNFCLILSFLVYVYKNEEVVQLFTQKLISFYHQILTEKPNEKLSIIFALIAIRKLVEHEECKQKLHSNQKISEALKHSGDYRQPLDYNLETQICFLTNNIVNRLNLNSHIQPNKANIEILTEDGFTARNCTANSFVPVRCSAKVSSGVYFYEVTIVSAGEMRIGWASRESELRDVCRCMQDTKYKHCATLIVKEVFWCNSAKLIQNYFANVLSDEEKMQDFSALRKKYFRDEQNDALDNPCIKTSMMDQLAKLSGNKASIAMSELLQSVTYKYGRDKGVGADRYSIAFDGYIGNIVHNGERFATGPKFFWNPGDVIGCLADFSKSKFKFYLNGMPVEYEMKPFVSSQAYFAVVSLAAHQQCRFNFGQEPFRFPLPELEFSTFHSLNSVQKCALLSPTLSANSYWFKGESQTLPIYRDKEQDQFSEMMFNLQCSIIIDKKVDIMKMPTEVADDIKLTFLALLLNQTGWLRFIQSLIETVGMVDGEARIDVIAAELCDTFKQLDDLIAINSYVPSCAKLLEMIWPYMNREANSYEECLEQRNVCLLLSICLIVSHEGRSASFSFTSKDQTTRLLSDEVLDFLENVISTQVKFDLYSTKILALAVIWRSAQQQRNCDTLRRHEKLVKSIEDVLQFSTKALEATKVTRLENEPFMVAMLQINLCAEACLSALGQNDIYSEDLKINDDSPTLHLENKSKGCLLSSDRLSARGETQTKQNARSSMCTSSGIYFYEVQLLTSGDMCIGWATGDFNFKRDNNPVGSDEYSIGFDGYRGCVWHNGTRYIVTGLDQWSVGDVLGCMLDTINRSYTFYLNGIRINIDYVKASSKPHFATVSLVAMQQCRFNFGQTKLKFKPKRVELCTFYQASKLHNDICKYCRVRRANVRFLDCDHLLICSRCASTPIQCIACDKERFEMANV